MNVDLSESRFQNVNLTGAKIMEAMLVNARISGLIDGLVLNDVEVAPLIDAEMVRRYPERAKLRPVDAAGARQAWAVIEELWAATKGRVVRALVDTLTDDELDQPRGDETVRSCLWTVFDEEWYHNWFANRDLDVLVPLD